MPQCAFGSAGPSGRPGVASAHRGPGGAGVRPFTCPEFTLLPLAQASGGYERPSRRKIKAKTETI